MIVLLSTLLLAEAVHAQTVFTPGYGSGFYGGPQFVQPFPGTATFSFANPFVRSAYAAELYYQDAMLANEEAAMSRRMEGLRRFERELADDDAAPVIGVQPWERERALRSERRVRGAW